MHRFQHVMVGLPRTQADAGLIRYAAMLARLGTFEEIRFVHVLPTRTVSGLEPDHGRTLAELETEVHELLGGVPAGLRICCDVLKGPLFDRMLQFAVEQEVDLVLIGHQREHPGHKALARRLAMKAPCSVWMVPDGASASLKRMLVPVDFSEHSLDTMRVATSMARLAGDVECLALHVRLHKVTVAHEGPEVKLAYEECGPMPRSEEAAAWERFMTQVDCEDAPIRPIVEEGSHVAHTIHRTALEQSADLVVMSTRGRTTSSAILLGSVTEDLIVETRVPLLVVKHFGARLHLLEALLDRAFGK
jgi:sulfate permease, SulP family